MTAKLIEKFDICLSYSFLGECNLKLHIKAG